MTTYVEQFREYSDLVRAFGDAVPPEPQLVYCAKTYRADVDEPFTEALVVAEQDGIWIANVWLPSQVGAAVQALAKFRAGRATKGAK